ncbi:DGQHR domain-containing protein [Nesterenkonia haasae]|uniref:DGQHR domain-containing protein n=1 Tax=Nesterenkonia haasae TaxID=2587813 RepID=UPI0013908AEA|nr:DGQHR domain-containing protein [Nesterenkonia haasae]
MEEYVEAGWEHAKTLTYHYWIQRPKSHDASFEDRVWAMCASLGFSTLNNDRQMHIPYGKHETATKQVDVFAVDDEIALVFECKSSAAEQPPHMTFKKEVEAIQGYRSGMISWIKKEFPGRKVCFILAANNVHVSEGAQERIRAADMAYLDETAVEYYLELSRHLGSASKYQLLGNILDGKRIEGLDVTVPAIRGKMGGKTYYSFSIEPEKLLKISYVLHRNSANSRWMPTYQRLIKAPRLKNISSFIDNGGFFPNSIIINIDSGKRSPNFSPAASQKNAGGTTLGTLQLPRRYRSAYVIDGQHRLYGFSHSPRAATEAVPVIAFHNLKGEEQLKLFMQINENQKSVPKNLQNTLNADLLWTSENLRQRAKALKLKISQSLGESKGSPLYNRVILGEEKSTPTRCITLDSIQRGIERGRFIGDFTASAVKKVGSFYRTSNDDTLPPVTDFLSSCIAYVREGLATQWNLGRRGIVANNPGFEALVRLIGDIVDHLNYENKCDSRSDPPEVVFQLARPYLDEYIEFVEKLDDEEREDLHNRHGSSAPNAYLRKFQGAVKKRYPSFDPPGYEEWVENQALRYNSESFTMITAIEKYLNTRIREILMDHFGDTWFKEGVPRKVYQDAVLRTAEREYDSTNQSPGDWWTEGLQVSHYDQVLRHGGAKRWNEVFAAEFEFPAGTKKSSWKEGVEWVSSLINVRNDVMHSRSVSEEQYAKLIDIFEHFQLSGTGGNL